MTDKTEAPELKPQSSVLQQDPKTGKWEEAIPEPYRYGIIQWVYLRITGYRDAYGRKARL